MFRAFNGTHAISNIHLCVSAAALCMAGKVSVWITWTVPSALPKGLLS